jgi:hypothetical protein
LKEHLDYKPLLRQLKSGALEALKTDYSEFTLNFFKAVNPKAPVYDKLRLALYCEYMIRFHNQISLKHPAEKISKLTGIELYFVNHFLDTYAEMKSTNIERVYYIRTDIHKQKLIYHILVVAFMLYDFKLNLEPLTRSLLLDSKTLISFCRQFGCDIGEKKTKDETIAKLRAPLTFRADIFQKK